MLVAICASAGAVFGLVRWLRSDLPSPEQVASIQAPVKTTVYDVHGHVLHEFYRENRSAVPIQRIPSNLIRATLSTEDRNFYQHWGIDLWGVGRALVTDVMHMRRTQGGSTITQQLARNLFLTHERSLSRKLKEAALAIELERNYSKDQILEMYFNQIYFGEGAYGVEAATKTYFDKPLKDLTLPEAALLAGIPANPSLYAPRRRPSAALARRAKVLRNMLATEAITQAQYDQAIHAPLGVTSVRYENDRAPYFVEMVRLHLDEKYGTNAVYEGGLKVWTTLDPELQVVAERALEKQLTQLEAALKLKVRHAPSPAATPRGCTRARVGTFGVSPGRRGGDRPAQWPDTRDGGRTRLERQQFQSGHPGPAPAGFGVQAVRLRRRNRQWLQAHGRGGRRARVVHGRNGKLYEPENYDHNFAAPSPFVTRFSTPSTSRPSSSCARSGRRWSRPTHGAWASTAPWARTSRSRWAAARSRCSNWFPPTGCSPIGGSAMIRCYPAQVEDRHGTFSSGASRGPPRCSRSRRLRP